jgi:type I restriction enzyme S subunit
MEAARKPVGELLDAVSRQPKIKRSEYQETGRFPIVDQSQADIAGYTDDESWLYQGELPVVIFGDHTRVLKFVDFPFCVGADGTQLLRPVTGNDIRYFYYALRNVDLTNYGYERHFKYLKEEQIPAPPLPVQRRIAGILSAYDELMENHRRRIRILEEMARALYREWFVHFRAPGMESNRRINSPLGPIPHGWEVGRLDDVLVLQRGFDLPKADRVEGTVPIYAATGVTGFHNAAKVKAPGVVTGRSGTIGDVLYVQEDFWPLNTALWVKEFPKAEPLYAYYVLSSLDLKQFNSGAAVPTLNRNDIHGFDALIPPRQLQKRFQEIVGAMFAQARTLELQIQNLRRTRDLLLPRLLSGQVALAERGGVC